MTAITLIKNKKLLAFKVKTPVALKILSSILYYIWNIMFYFTSLFNYFVTKCQNGIEFLAWKILGLIKDEMVETTE